MKRMLCGLAYSFVLERDHFSLPERNESLNVASATIVALSACAFLLAGEKTGIPHKEGHDAESLTLACDPGPCCA